MSLAKSKPQTDILGMFILRVTKWDLYFGQIIEQRPQNVITGIVNHPLIIVFIRFHLLKTNTVNNEFTRLGCVCKRLIKVDINCELIHVHSHVLASIHASPSSFFKDRVRT